MKRLFFLIKKGLKRSFHYTFVKASGLIGREQIRKVSSSLDIPKWMFKQARHGTISIILIAIFGALVSLCSVGIAIISKILIDSVTANKFNQVTIAVIVFFLLIISLVGLQAVVSILSVRTAEEMSNRLRHNLFTRLSNSQWMDFSKYHSEDILTRMTSDVGSVTQGFTSILPQIIAFSVQLFGAFAALMFLEPILAVLALLLGPLVIVLSRFIGKRLKKIHLKIQESESIYRAFIHEAIQNMFIVKAFSHESASGDKIDKLQSERLSWVFRRSRLEAGAGAILSLGYWLGFLLAFIWGAFSLQKGGTSFGTLAAFLQLVEQIQIPFIGLAYTVPQLISAAASATRLMEFDKLCTEEQDNSSFDWKKAGIRFEEVSFNYEKDKPVLKKVSFYIEPGEIIGIVGASGEGKTTTIRLILSLIKPNTGRVIFYDGKNAAHEASKASRKLISYVPQGNTLFSGTIAENLRISKEAASEEEMIKAIKAATAWDFIENLPKGLNTLIGERGLGLSEGQAQRIAIARALLRDAPVLILDEATSQLDAQNEKNILQTIKELNPSRTCVIITHHTAALEICNRILKIEEGRIV